MSILAGMISFGVGNFSTFEVGVFAIGLLIVAAWAGAVVLVWRMGSCILGLVAATSGFVSPCGGFAALSNVTRLVSGVGLSICTGVVSSVLLRMASNFLSALICSNAFVLLFFFNACVRSFSALIIVSAGVMVGCVMYFVLKNTAFDTRLPFVCFT